MRTFFASLAVFALLLALIVCNAIYVKSATKNMEDLLQAATLTDSTSLSRVEEGWQKTKKMLALSAPFEEMRMLDEHLVAMRAAADTGVSGDFERARLLAISVLERIREQEALSFGNLL